MFFFVSGPIKKNNDTKTLIGLKAVAEAMRGSADGLMAAGFGGFQSDWGSDRSPGTTGALARSPESESRKRRKKKEKW